MSRLIRWAIGLILALSIPGSGARFPAPQAIGVHTGAIDLATCSADGRVQQEGVPPPPIRRPVFPRRPGGEVPPLPPRRPLPFQRPGGVDAAPTNRNPVTPGRPEAAPSTAPRYVMETTGSQRVAGVYRSEVTMTGLAAEEWEVYFPVAVPLSRQKDVSTSMEPAAQRIDEPGRAHRPILRARIPTGAGAPQTVPLAVRYEGTLLARRLVPSAPGQAPPSVPPLNFQERFTSLGATQTLDFRASSFQAWLDNNGLRRGQDEGDVDFARRVFKTMIDQQSYKDGVPVQPISVVCELTVLDCDTLSLLFAGAMRSGGVPARVVYGWPAQSIQPGPGRPLSGHTQAEFFADGVGWVPVDLAYGLIHKQDDPMKFFGEDAGELLIVQVDPDYLLPHPNGVIERVASIHPGPSSWARGKTQKPSVVIRPISWEVERRP